jgi:hypothetical protein
MLKLFYILTCFSVLFAINCDKRLDVERKPIHPEPTKEDKLRAQLCPPCECPTCPTDPCSEDEKVNPWSINCYYAGKKTDTENPLPPRDFGKGIYYFPVIQHDFAKSLSMFMTAHPELRILTIAEDSISARRGYFVIFERTVIDKTEKEEK